MYEPEVESKKLAVFAPFNTKISIDVSAPTHMIEMAESIDENRFIETKYILHEC
jgi:hypothetical protein